MSTEVFNLGDATIATTVTSRESAVDTHIQYFLSNRDNARKVIGLDFERTTILDVSEETDDLCHESGSYSSYGKSYGRKDSGLNVNRTVVKEDLLEESENSKMKSRVATLQLCDGHTCLIVRLFYLDSIPNSFLNFLQLPDFAFVGIGIKESVAKLEEDYGPGCKNAVDLGQLAASVQQMPHLAACGVEYLALMVDSVKLDKPTSVICDWGKDRLNKKQIKFATANAFASFKIGNKLLSG